MDEEKFFAKLQKAKDALTRMDDGVFRLYCQLMGIDKDDAIDRMLISIEPDELLAAIDDKYFAEVAGE